MKNYNISYFDMLIRPCGQVVSTSLHGQFVSENIDLRVLIVLLVISNSFKL